MLCFVLYSFKYMVASARQLTFGEILTRIAVFDAFMNMEYLFLRTSNVLRTSCTL